MGAYYQATSVAASPVKLVEMKKALRLPEGDYPEDDFISDLIKASTHDVESRTSRDFRVKTWEMLVDEFADRIPIRRDPVDTVTKIEYLVDDVWTEISTDVYYLKKHHQGAEILLKLDQTWPTDLDEVEHGIKVTFTTAAHPHVEKARAAIREHVAFMYENRGDCSLENSRDALVESGAMKHLSRTAIAKV